MSIANLKNNLKDKKHFKVITIEWAKLYIMLCIVIVVFTELFAKANTWTFISVLMVFLMLLRVSNTLSVYMQSTLVRIYSLADSQSILAEAVQIQSTKLEDIRQFLSRLIRPSLPAVDKQVH